MPNYGRVLTHTPATVASGSPLTISAPAGGQLKFARGATFVTFKLGPLAQVTVIPAGIRHTSDYEITVDFPQLGAGVYQCLVTSGLDLAETAQPVIGGGLASGAAPGQYGRVLNPPSPAQARPGDVITITAQPLTAFVFDPWGTYVTFGGTTGTIYQVTVVPSGVTVADSKTMRLAVPQLPPGAYAIRVSSGASTAECAGPQVILAGGTGPTRAATPAPHPMLTAPTGATPATRLTINAPFTRTPIPPGPVILGSGAPPMFPAVSPPSLLTRLTMFLTAMIGSFIPSFLQPKRGTPQSGPSSPSGSPPAGAPSPATPAPPTGSGASPASPPAPAAPVLAAPPSHYEGGHAVEYLIDGGAFFQRMSDVCDEVAALPGNTGYLHVAFWLCDEQTVLDAAGKRFIDKVKALGAARKEVKILLWTPVGAQSFIETVKKANAKCKQQVDALALPSVEVQLLSHPLPFGSYHQKIVIAGVGEYAKVLVGGLNVHATYRDNAPHAGGSRWHDAGVLIAGPATATVEAEWDAQWALTNGKPPAGPTFAGNMGDQSVFIGVTDPPRLSIRDELVARIQTAEDYVYMENYGIFDPDVMTALGQKLKSKRDVGQPFEAILLVPHQAMSPHYAWLHYVTYCHLSFMSCSSFSFVEGANTYTVSKAVDGKTTWSFDYAGGVFGIGNWYEDSTVSWDTGSTSVKNIRGFTGETLMYTLGSAVAGTPNTFDNIYLHSKVAIVDDAFALVGSANFTPRSMRQDGELSAFIHGTSVAAFRTSLWAEYCAGAAPTPAGFAAGARTNHGSAQGGKLTPGQLYVMPLQFSVPQREPSGIESWIGADQR